MDRLVFGGTLERIHLEINKKKGIHNYPLASKKAYGKIKNGNKYKTKQQRQQNILWIQPDWKPGHSCAISPR